jgi:NAD(P)-dependent dehydrogenase (short-subunit alcohol dehydrogenase family)
MELQGAVAVVTGGGSGLGLASAQALAAQGARVLIVDLPTSPGAEVAADLECGFAPADVTNEAEMQAAMLQAEAMGPVRILIHCAGRGGALRVLEKDGTPGSLDHYAETIRVNLIGSFNALRLAAASMAKSDAVEGERGVCILTASIAGYEGQIGQMAYASSKAGVIGMTLTAARDLASRGIRVCTIAPGIMDTPMLQRLPDAVKQSLAAGVPNPHRLGTAAEYAALALHIIGNGYLNGETIRLDGALRMAPR